MQHPPASAVPAAPSLSIPHRPRSALALGVVGALGEELLAGLVGGGRYATVHVGVDQAIGSATARFRPWVVGDGVVLADDAYICVTGDETFVPKATPMHRVAAVDAVTAARTARDCGASRLVLVSPLPALLQLNAASHTLSSASEVEISQMGFQTLLVIRPTADAAAAAGGWFPGIVRTFTRMVLEIMLPQRVQALRARTAAAAILEAVDRAEPGIHVLGARELALIVEETMPGALPKQVRLR
ncbi:MAG: hypothetical protein WBC37_03180 [Burkholderiaceae bacterium]